MQIEVDNLCIELAKRPILTAFDLVVQSGMSVAILGRSGVGKTTLLRAIAGLIPPCSGAVRIGGQSPQYYYGSAKIGFLFQRAYLWQHLTVRQNLELVYQIHARPIDHNQIEKQLAAVDLLEVASLHPFQLSAGMKARAAIARALCLPPQVLLMDEPFAALDPLRRTALNRTIRGTARELEATTVWITHDVIEALMFADRIVVLNGTPEPQIFDTTTVPPVLDPGQLRESTRTLRDRIIAAFTVEGRTAAAAEAVSC
jgi:ABC-type nitrate/sulfonate/bicarbonate transport system ATPase subunit